MIAPLWLSHHHGEGLSRCWNIRGLRICARCSGLFPALLVTMGVEAFWPLPQPMWLPLRLSLAFEVLLLVPGLWDVLREVSAPQSPEGLSSNGVRFASGAGLGIALGHGAMVGYERGWTTPEALLPLGAAIFATLWFLDLYRVRRRLAALESDPSS
jgi:uncharacterized membrane protein